MFQNEKKMECIIINIKDIKFRLYMKFIKMCTVSYSYTPDSLLDTKSFVFSEYEMMKNGKYLGKEDTLLNLLKISRLVAINTIWFFPKQAWVILQELQPDAWKKALFKYI